MTTMVLLQLHSARLSTLAMTNIKVTQDQVPGTISRITVEGLEMQQLLTG